jgi:hypothetical protein
MTSLRAFAVFAVSVLLIEAVMVELEKVSPQVVRWGAPCFAIEFVILGVLVRRFTPLLPSLIGAFGGAIVYVTIGYWVAGYVGDGKTVWVWLGSPVVLTIATMYFFVLMAIGIGAASVRPRGSTS